MSKKRPDRAKPEGKKRPAKEKKEPQVGHPFAPLSRIVEEAKETDPEMAKLVEALADHPLVRVSRMAEEAKKTDPGVAELVEASRKGDIPAVKRLLAQGLSPNQIPPNDDQMETAVWAAVFARKPEMIRVLAEGEADLEEGFPDTPLVVAAGWGHVELIRALLDGGANPNRPNNSHETPLLNAVQHNHVDAVAELLKRGADPNLVPKKQKYDTVTNYSPLEYAAMTGSTAILDILVAAGGSKVKNLDALLLCSAAARGDLAEMKKKIEQEGVDANAKDSMHRTPLCCAASDGRARAVKYLLEHGADVNLPAGARSDGESPLIAAVNSGKLDVVKMLVEAGADLDYAPKEYKDGTALAYAKESRRSKLVEYLLQLHKQRTGGKAKPSAAAKMRGVTTFDTNDAVVLIAGPVEAVAREFAALRKAAVWEQDALGKKVKLTARCYALWKLVDQPWTATMKLRSPYAHWPRVSDAEAISKTLGSRGLYVANSDTGGVTQYALFDQGKLVELFDSGSASYYGDRSAVVEQFAKQYGLDFSGLPNISIAKDRTFASSLRKIDVARIKQDLDFVDTCVKELDAFIPFFIDEWPATGKPIELTLEGFGPDDIERLDYVAI
ncbi:MAG: ankyrin repeat domain-containing protein [Phycisphaerae bacterium]|nr:ankyrin repeat domain-containing protein [Phycisphaerae bacterium]